MQIIISAKSCKTQLADLNNVPVHTERGERFVLNILFVCMSESYSRRLVIILGQSLCLSLGFGSHYQTMVSSSVLLGGGRWSGQVSTVSVSHLPELSSLSAILPLVSEGNQLVLVDIRTKISINHPEFEL